MTAAACESDAIATELLAALDELGTLRTDQRADPGFGFEGSIFGERGDSRSPPRPRQRPIGRKIGFTNCGIWAEYGVRADVGAR